MTGNGIPEWIAQPNVESSSVGGVKGNYQMDDVLDKSAIDEFKTGEPQRSMVGRVKGDRQMGPAQQKMMNQSMMDFQKTRH